MIRSRPFLLAILIAAAQIAAAQNTIEFEGRYWIPQFSSQIRVEQNGVGTDIDARRDLGMTNTNFPQGSVAWRRGWSRLSFTYTPLDFSGDQSINQTVVFHGRQYTVGTRVQSELSVQHLQLSWTYELIHVKNGMFRVGPVLEADGFLMHGRITAPALMPPVSESEDLSVGLPCLGLAILIQPHRRLEIYGQVAGMQVGGYGYFIGSDSGVRLQPFKLLLLSAGYQTFNLHVDDSPDFFQLQLRGPFVGAGIRF